ncbi:MAG: amino acid ABC transporter permease [Acidimicrobiia bacterium]
MTIELPDTLELAPEPPPHGPRVWLRENLFSSPASGVISVLAVLLVLAVIRGLLGFIFAPERRWDAVTYNMRLLMVQAYPAGQMTRIWASVGIIVVLLAVTFAFYRIGGKTSLRKIGTVLMGVGSGALLGGLLGPWGVTFSPFGVESMRGFLGWVIVGLALVVSGYLVRTVPGDRAKDQTIPILGVVVVLMAGILVLIWTILLPVPTRIDGVQTTVFEEIAMTTRVPWTVIAVLAVVFYWAAWFLRDRVSLGVAKTTIISLWVASFPVLVLVILRDPDVDYGRAFSWYLPIALGFIVLGGLLLNFIADAKGEAGRAIGAILLVVGLASFLVPMEFVVRFLLLLLAMFALLATTFGGKGAARWRFLGLWAGLVAALVYTIMIITAPSTIEVPGKFFLGGLSLTILLAFSAIVLSFPLGIILALARTSKMPIFRLMATTYIELVRGVPLITWLIVGFIMFPVLLPEGVEVGGVARAIGAMTFFSAAYLAENVRGGLQAVPRGQYEAADAMGLTTTQTTVFIVLPQALRAVIPALVGQVIALFKDTSLVTLVGLFDFLHIARSVIPNQTQPFVFLGSLKETLLFAAVVYWMFTFTFSRISLRMEKKLGVGER